VPRPVYLDYNATTPVAPEVVQTILPFLQQHFGNASSVHAYGRAARAALDKARKQVAALIAAQTDEIIFTGGATEANNLALRGVTAALQGRKRHLIVSAVEHPAVLEPALALQRAGWALDVVGVDRHGLVDPDDVRKALRDDTALVSIMHANNEVGTIEPIAEIAALAHARGALVHTDAAQTAGKVPIDVGALDVDLLTLAGHKFYATKGVGALYLKRGTPLQPDVRGGGQERGLRPGTENVALVAGMGAAAELVAREVIEVAPRLQSLRDELHRRLAEAIPGLQLNGHPALRLPNTLNVSFPQVNNAELLGLLEDEVAASLGSACHSASGTVSGVLGAMGVNAQRAMGAVRFSVGARTTLDEINRAVAALTRAWRQLRQAAGVAAQ
jgi:cysteine desulfurase